MVRRLRKGSIVEFERDRKIISGEIEGLSNKQFRTINSKRFEIPPKADVFLRKPVKKIIRIKQSDIKRRIKF